MPGSVYDKIVSAYFSLTAAEKRTADFIIANKDKCQYMSIAELAAQSGVAEATVSRFCRTLGYKSFPALKLAMVSSTAVPKGEGILSGRIEDKDSIQEMSEKLYNANLDAMHQTLKLIDPKSISKATDVIFKAEKVVCMGQGGAMLMAEEASHLFSTVSGKFTSVFDSHSQLVATINMDHKDAILFFSYSGTTKDMIDTISVARKRKIPVILITRFAKSPGAELADIVLLFGSNESPLHSGSVPARIAQLYLIDVLFSEFCRRDRKAARASRKRIATETEVKHL